MGIKDPSKNYSDNIPTEIELPLLSVEVKPSIYTLEIIKDKDEYENISDDDDDNDDEVDDGDEEEDGKEDEEEDDDEEDDEEDEEEDTLDIIAKQPQIPLPSYTLRALMKQILEGIHIIHSEGFIHRDIKCDNILIHCPQGTGRVYVKISDFGFTKKEDLNNEQLYYRGTICYMAPEYFKKPRIITKKTDIYSVGITFYNIITCSFPVNENGIEEQKQKLAQLKCIEKPSEITDNQLWGLLSQMFEFDPDKRISAEQALQHPFFTSPEAIADISPEQHELAQKAIVEQQMGNKSITIFDTNPSYILKPSF
ncbi:MAG: putative protein kinase [Streblomastix strix]|uniref:Protein kinase domain-containing protein n=1 Tax=Streblomastix strix TaxID=222440 RepID=A0A5J4WYW7_9EUKA|nr:MAG: putative protein kinase [Streblomastix strix]